MQRQLADLGLTGDAAGALLSEAQGAGGNAAIKAMIARGEIGQYASLYQQRAGLQGSVGMGGGDLVFGQALRESERAAGEAAVSLARIEDLLRIQELRREKAADVREQRRAQREAENADRTAEGVGFALNGAAASGHRNKKAGRR